MHGPTRIVSYHSVRTLRTIFGVHINTETAIVVQDRVVSSGAVVAADCLGVGDVCFSRHLTVMGFIFGHNA